MRLKLFLFILIAFVIGFLCSHYFEKRGAGMSVTTEMISDTVRYIDTVRYVEPIAKERVITRYERVLLPVSCDSDMVQSGGDNAMEDITDSVAVVLPITQTMYSDSTYRAWVSGYRARLDSIMVFPTREVVTNRVVSVVRKRWGIGPMVGVGVSTSGGVAVSVGVGIQYNILNF